MNIKSLVIEVLRRNRLDILVRVKEAISLKTGLLKRKFRSTPISYGQLPRDVQDAFRTNVFNVRSTADELPQELWRSASIAMDGQHQVFGRSVCINPESLDWHQAIIAEGAWPQVHWTEIPYRQLGHLGDIKYPWELARQDFLVAVAMVAGSDQDKNAASFIERVLRSFDDSNPHEIGIHWISNMEIGLRSLSWIWVLSLAGDKLSKSCRNLLARELCQNGEHIYKRLSFTKATGPNNHLIGDAACLLVIGAVFGGSQVAIKWCKLAEGYLAEAIKRQVLAGGMHFERSFGYHLFVMEFLWNVQLCGVGTEQLRQLLPETLLQMTRCLIWARSPEGTLPTINDNDDGSALPLANSESTRIDLLIGLAASHFDQASWTQEIVDHDTTEFFVKLLTERADSPLVTQQGVAVFTEAYNEAAGIVVAKSEAGDCVLVENHEDTFPNSGHNHASLMNVLYWYGSSPILVDSGTYGYNGVAKIRNHLRGTTAHNCVTVDGQSQAEPARNFGWLSSATPKDLKVTESDATMTVSGSHQCYQGAEYRRLIHWDQSRRVLLIRDEMVSLAGGLLGDQRAEQYWHFSPGIRCLAINDRGLYSLGRSDLYFGLCELKADSVELTTDYNDNLVSAFSSQYGSLESSNTLCRRWVMATKEPKWTVLFASDTQPQLPKVIRQEQEESVRVGDRTYRFARGDDGRFVQPFVEE
ncbi:MAG: alginate lyase family protein [Rubripirellula sp.]